MFPDTNRTASDVALLVLTHSPFAVQESSSRSHWLMSRLHWWTIWEATGIKRESPCKVTLLQWRPLSIVVSNGGTAVSRGRAIGQSAFLSRNRCCVVPAKSRNLHRRFGFCEERIQCINTKQITLPDDLSVHRGDLKCRIAESRIAKRCLSGLWHIWYYRTFTRVYLEAFVLSSFWNISDIWIGFFKCIRQ